MSALNKQKSKYTERTHEGARVKPITAEQKLTRLTLANMLWENSFYMNGSDAAEQIAETVKLVSPSFTSDLAKKARNEYKLRHVPLLLMRELARHGTLKAADLAEVIQRPDELSEFLAIYWKDGKQPIANQVKKGLAKALTKFNEYQLAKWDKNNTNISIRDVMFLSHPKPVKPEQAILFNKLANEALDTPDTWEVQLSAGADKKETFERLMSENKLGALAYLRNLRNMVHSGVDDSMIIEYGSKLNTEKVLPFRFISAARHVQHFHKMYDMLEDLMLKSLKEHEKLSGKTALLVDVSGSMFGTKISKKSDLDRFDAAAALAILCREVCEGVDIFTYSEGLVKVRDIHGFSLVRALKDSQPHRGTYLGEALKSLEDRTSGYDRIIVFTDEQSADVPKLPKGSKGYIINVANYANGINEQQWTTITGFSEAVIDYIQAVEKL